MSTTKHPTPQPMPYAIRIPGPLETEIENACKTTGLKKSDVMRMAIERGLQILIDQLATTKPREGSAQ